MKLTHRTPDRFWELDLTHWFKVKAARQNAGLPTGTGRAPVENHPLEGRLLKSQAGELLVVERVCRDWLAGWFEVAHLRALTSAPGVLDASAPFRNVSSEDAGVQAAVLRFDQHYTLTA